MPIRIDGVDIRSLPVREYRRNIGLVLQEPFLFFGTIAENIAYGKPDASREEIVAAARAAHAHEFILRLPHGYDSLVGERGQALSGGERQRISIARALLIDPRILILDEATSSVDTETELEIQAALDNLIRGRTTMAIAHRLSTLRRADRLVVLDRGRIVEQGRHEELLARKGAYYRLERAQTEFFNGGRAAGRRGRRRRRSRACPGPAQGYLTYDGRRPSNFTAMPSDDWSSPGPTGASTWTSRRRAPSRSPRRRTGWPCLTAAAANWRGFRGWTSCRTGRASC